MSTCNSSIVFILVFVRLAKEVENQTLYTSQYRYGISISRVTYHKSHMTACFLIAVQQQLLIVTFWKQDFCIPITFC